MEKKRKNSRSSMLIPNRIRAVIFDMDGVIIDTHDAFYRCMINWAESKGLGLTREKLMSWGSLDSTQFWSRMKTEFHLQEDIETLISSYDKDGEMSEYSKIGLMSGLVDLLDRLHSRGILTAVATSGRQFRVSHVLDHFNIRCKFDGVFCNDDIQNPKPDPEIYLLVAAKLDCSVSECLVIEDSSNGIRSARSAGMTCFGHTRNKSNWENLDDADELFDSFDELVIENGKMNIGFLASHGGSNMQAIIDACKQDRLQALPSIVISNNSGSGALVRAKEEGLPCFQLSGKTHPNPEELDQAILSLMLEHAVDVVVLAGYMKMLGPLVLKHFAGRILNIHPALLPKFGGKGMYGIHVHEAVIAAGEKESGVSIHLVDAEYDTGPIIAQAHVPVEPGDTPETLAARVLQREHTFFAETLQKIVVGEIDLPLHKE